MSGATTTDAEVALPGRRPRSSLSLRVPRRTSSVNLKVAQKDRRESLLGSLLWQQPPASLAIPTTPTNLGYRLPSQQSRSVSTQPRPGTGETDNSVVNFLLSKKIESAPFWAMPDLKCHVAVAEGDLHRYRPRQMSQPDERSYSEPVEAKQFQVGLKFGPPKSRACQACRPLSFDHRLI